ncbi:unnamed protein product [Somion occarium]|uniref:Uncharacterized protein n=1 Tax=Somion occarium TaxID=3059160 RepID=A0ABP1CNB4_9APHY
MGVRVFITTPIQRWDHRHQFTSTTTMRCLKTNTRSLLYTSTTILRNNSHITHQGRTRRRILINDRMVQEDSPVSWSWWSTGNASSLTSNTLTFRIQTLSLLVDATILDAMSHRQRLTACARRSLPPQPPCSLGAVVHQRAPESHPSLLFKNPHLLVDEEHPLDPRGYPPPPPGANMNSSVHSPSTNRLPQGSPHIVLRYPIAVVRNLPPINMMRPLSPGPDDHTEMKRAKQPTLHSPESRQVDNSSPAILTMLPPHPQPIGAGLVGHAPVGPDRASARSSCILLDHCEDEKGHTVTKFKSS